MTAPWFTITLAVCTLAGMCVAGVIDWRRSR